MNELVPEENVVLIAYFIVAAIAASIVIWARAGRRLVRGEPVLPYEGRRSVPWSFGDVAIIFGVYLAPALAGLALSPLLGTDAARAGPAKGGPEELGVSHPVIELLASNPGLFTLLFCVFVVVVVAPVVEEFLFRLVLQGWLERRERDRIRQYGIRPRIRGAMPVLLTAILFASLHFRTAQPKLEPDRVVELLAQVGIWNLVTLVAGVGWLRLRRGATLADLGLAPERVLSDFRLGVVTFLAIAAPIYLLQGLLHYLLSDLIAPDPITLVFFAIALGVLFFRTHRITAPIALHMALNGTSLLVAWIAAK